MRLGLVAIAALALTLTVGATAACAQRPIPPAVQAVIDRSFATRDGYGVVMRVEVVLDGRRFEDTSAEFRQGAMHRVENGLRRVLIDCDTGETASFEVSAGRVVSREDQSGACGVAVNADRVQSARMLAPASGPYGRADVIELTGADYVRRYAVTEDGIIVDNEWVPRRANVGFSIRTLSVEVRRGAQDPAMFVESALDRGFAELP
jgi:hypothetical protein